VIAHISKKMSRTRAPVEIGFLSCDETVKSWAEVQKRASPTVWICVAGAWR
jgi:hypothetical protein